MHSRKASLSSHGTSSGHSPSNSTHNLLLASRPNLSISLPSPGSHNNERSVSSLEKEIMRLQEVLKEREAEITELEASLKESQRARDSGSPDQDKTLLHVNGVNGFDASTVNGSKSAALSPRTLDQFDHIRKSMENGHTPEGPSSVMSDDESLERLNELMLSVSVLTIPFVVDADE